MIEQLISDALLLEEQETPAEQLPPEILANYKERVRVLLAELFRENKDRSHGGASGDVETDRGSLWG